MRSRFFLWVFFLSSCASLGTKTKTNKSIDLSSVKVIGVVTTRSTFPDEGVNKITDSLFLNLMVSQLHTATGKEIKYLGETNDFLKHAERILRESNVDAVVQCEIYLAQMATLDKSKRFNSRVRTQMFKVPEKIFIAETDFNTTMGKFYGRHPLLYVAINDGVLGAVKPFLPRRVTRFGNSAGMKGRRSSVPIKEMAEHLS